ncbi:MAG: ribosome small subunit-dependent GTPase A [Bacilli bacterium]|jgi:ribosome biogenesis GTPase|nr:ribosome small subunit-dependent GTPase A [Bacilli bacterium]
MNKTNHEGLIISLRGDNYFVEMAGIIYKCKARGLFRLQEISPVVGDRVMVDIQNYQEGYIVEVLTRQNYLNRPKIANIDNALIIISYLDPHYSYFLLNKFLAIIEHLNIRPIICITKADLASNIQEIKDAFQDYYDANYDVVITSINDQNSINNLKMMLIDKLSVLVGQSGAGKSSLLNMIDPTLHLETNIISKALNRGKHTTRHVEIFHTSFGMIADSPGFSSLDLDLLDAHELAISYHDFKEASQYCKFNNCLHINEPGCQVKKLVLEKKISSLKYQDYLLFQEEIKKRKVRY